jgi:CRISPR-associated protein Cas1
VRLIDVLHVCAFGNVQVTAQAMRELFSRDVDVFHFSGGGWLLGFTTGLPSKNVMLRIQAGHDDIAATIREAEYDNDLLLAILRLTTAP